MKQAVTRLLHSTIALVAMAALLLAGPIGSGAAATVGAGGQGSPLERALDKLTPAQRAQLERQLTEQLEEAGVHLEAPSDSSSPVLLLFIAAALMFLPSVFQSIADTIFGWVGEVGGIEGIEPF